VLRPAVGHRLPGQVFNPDQWDGYQADQRALLEAMRTSRTSPVVLTGDIHSSWANDLPTDPAAYVASRATSSGGVRLPVVTSDGFKEVLGSAATATAVTAAFQAANPWVRYLEGIGHGFAVLDVTPERVQTDFFFIRTGGDKGLAVDPRLDPAASVGTRPRTRRSRARGRSADRCRRSVRAATRRARRRPGAGVAVAEPAGAPPPEGRLPAGPGRGSGRTRAD
jgi:hypothetical protein